MTSFEDESYLRLGDTVGEMSGFTIRQLMPGRALVVERGRLPGPEILDLAVRAGLGLHVMGLPEGAVGLEWIPQDVAARLPHLWVTMFGCPFDPIRIEGMTGLRSLDLWATLTRPLSLAALGELQSVALTWQKGKVVGLEGLRSLRRLYIERPDVRDPRLREQLAQVRPIELTLTNTRSMRDLSLLPTSEALTKLQLHCPPFLDLAGVERFAGLRELHLTSVKQVVNGSALAACVQLESVVFENCGQIDDMTWVRQVPLRRLWFIGERVPVTNDVAVQLEAAVDDFMAPDRVLRKAGPR